MKKTIALYPFYEKRHSIHNNTLDLLKKHFNVLYYPQKNKNKEKALSSLSRNIYFRYIYHKFIRRFISLIDFKKNNVRKLREKYDILFSTNHIPPFKTDFIIDIEVINALTGYKYEKINKEYIKKKLESKECKLILPWYNCAKETLVKTIDCRNFMDKIKVIPFAIKSVKIAKKYDKKKINLLFVSSANLPFDFELKGGIITLEAFKFLTKKYPNLNLFIRSKVPKYIKRKYGNLKGVHFVEKFLSDKEMHNLFLDTDFLLEPVPGVSLLLECMNYSIPVVTTDFWVFPEMVKQGKTGFLVDSSPIFGKKGNMDKYLKNLDENYLNLYKKNPNKEMIRKFIIYSSKLIEDKRLRTKMSKATKKQVQKNGEFSLDKRNKELLKAINQVIK